MSAVTVLVIGPTTQCIKVVKDSIFALCIFEIVDVVDATVDHGHSNACSVQTQVPCIVGQHSHRCIIHLLRDWPIWRDISNFGIIGQQFQTGRRQAHQQPFDRAQVLPHHSALCGNSVAMLLCRRNLELHNNLHGTSRM